MTVARCHQIAERTCSGAAKAGRPRSVGEDAIIASKLDALQARGYASSRIDAIAKRAG